MSARLAGSLISGAVLGKALGFARELEMARLLGAGVVADSFRGAMTAVLLPVAPIQSDMLPSVLIPLHRSWADSGEQAQRSAALAILMTLLASVVAVAVCLLAAAWVGLLVAQFDATAQRLTVRFVQVMALAIPASVLTSCLGSIEVALGRSRIMAIRASVQNVSIMVGIAWLAFAGQPMALAWSFVVAFNLTAAYATTMLLRQGGLAVRGLRWGLLANVGLSFWRRFRPLLAVPLADQGNILLERVLASGVAIGAVASLDYARTLTETAFFLVSQPIGYVVLTRASGALHGTADDVRRISQRLLALALPASAFLVIFAADIVQVVLARGAFNEHAALLTAGALRGIAVGLWAATLGWVLVRMLNAAGRNAMAAAIAVSAYAGNAAFNALAVPYLGTLGLGLGEAVRGFVLLGGTALALGCGLAMLRCLGVAAAITAPLVIAGLAIAHGVAEPLPRLALSAPLFAAATAVWLGVLLPEQRRWALALARRPRRLSARG